MNFDFSKLCKWVTQPFSRPSMADKILRARSRRREDPQNILEALSKSISPSRAELKKLYRDAVAETAYWKNRAQEAELAAAGLLVDDKTGLPNQTGAHMRLQRVLEREGEFDKYPYVALFMTDLDHFKAYNDTQGHAAGDVALKRVAHVGSKVIRSNDMLARIHGDEFVIISPLHDTDGAHVLGERYRHSIEQEFENDPVRITCSVGLVIVHRDQFHLIKNPAELFELADTAMYEAKGNHSHNGGRNRVSLIEFTEERIVAAREKIAEHARVVAAGPTDPK